MALLHALSGVAAMIVSLFTKSDSLAPAGIAKGLGWLVFLSGMLLFAWAVACLKKAFFGNVEPVSDTLITTGPYRLVRHSLYLGMAISTIGLAIGMRSLLGLVATLLVFIPTAIYRARLEENAMARRFGQEWDDYIRRTCFMVPPFW